METALVSPESSSSDMTVELVTVELMTLEPMTFELMTTLEQA